MKQCAYPPCAKRFKPKRSWQRYDFPECRMQDYVRREVEASETHYNDAEVVRGSTKAPDKGVHVYLLPADFDDLEPHLPHLSLAVTNKLRKARARLPKES